MPVVVTGLGFGDEGKGSIVDFLARRCDSLSLVVRYSGGAQAAHTVVCPDGREHTFSQFGSGTFFPGSETFLSRHMLVNPVALLSEERHLQSVGVTDAFDRLYIDARALVTNPFQVSANRLRELARDKKRHGSCGMGIGETKQDHSDHPETTIIVDTLKDPGLVRAKLELSRQLKLDEFEKVVWDLPRTEAVAREWHLLRDKGSVDACVKRFQEVYSRAQIVGDTFLPEHLHRKDHFIIFEGSQGVLLDHAYGLFPHVTRGDTTLKNALDLLNGTEPFTIGVLRAYSTRHGAGPFPTEDTTWNLPEPHNGTNAWQQGFRAGPLDILLARYAIQAIGGVDAIALNHLDHLGPSGAPYRLCREYDSPVLHTRFSPTHGPITQLLPRFSYDLEARKRFTSAVEQVRPLYTSFSNEDSFKAQIREDLGHSAILEGRGPTANDKKFKINRLKNHA